MSFRAAWVQTVRKPDEYSYEQLENALATASTIRRGKFVYTMPPPHDHGEQLDENGVCVFCHRRAWL